MCLPSASYTLSILWESSSGEMTVAIHPTRGWCEVLIILKSSSRFVSDNTFESFNKQNFQKCVVRMTEKWQFLTHKTDSCNIFFLLNSTKCSSIDHWTLKRIEDQLIFQKNDISNFATKLWKNVSASFKKNLIRVLGRLHQYQRSTTNLVEEGKLIFVEVLLVFFLLVEHYLRFSSDEEEETENCW